MKSRPCKILYRLLLVAAGMAAWPAHAGSSSLTLNLAGITADFQLPPGIPLPDTRWNLQVTSTAATVWGMSTGVTHAYGGTCANVSCSSLLNLGVVDIDPEALTMSSSARSSAVEILAEADMRVALTITANQMGVLVLNVPYHIEINANAGESALGILRSIYAPSTSPEGSYSDEEQTVLGYGQTTRWSNLDFSPINLPATGGTITLDGSLQQRFFYNPGTTLLRWDLLALDIASAPAAAVPEPQTAALMFCGASVLAWLSRRRQVRAAWHPTDLSRC